MIKDDDDKDYSKYVELSRPSEHIESAVSGISLDAGESANGMKKVDIYHPVDYGELGVEVYDTSTSQDDYTGPCTSAPLPRTELRYTSENYSSPLTEASSLDYPTSGREGDEESRDGQTLEGVTDDLPDMAGVISIGEDNNTVAMDLRKDE